SFPNTDRVRTTADYDGAHFLYQDFLVPATATSATLTFNLYIQNFDPNGNDPFGTTDINGPFTNTDPSIAGISALDYFPGIATRPKNQQVRLDLIDPNAPIDTVNTGVGGGVLVQLVRTMPGYTAVYNDAVTNQSTGAFRQDLYFDDPANPSNPGL